MITKPNNLKASEDFDFLGKVKDSYCRKIMKKLTISDIERLYLAYNEDLEMDIKQDIFLIENNLILNVAEYKKSEEIIRKEYRNKYKEQQKVNPKYSDIECDPELECPIPTLRPQIFIRGLAFGKKKYTSYENVWDISNFGNLFLHEIIKETYKSLLLKNKFIFENVSEYKVYQNNSINLKLKNIHYYSVTFSLYDKEITRYGMPETPYLQSESDLNDHVKEISEFREIAFKISNELKNLNLMPFEDLIKIEKRNTKLSKIKNV